MATVSCSSPSSLFFHLVGSSTRAATSPPTSLSFPSFHFAPSVSLSHRYSTKPVEDSRIVMKAVAEEEAGLISEGGEGDAQESEETVSVPVSPSDMLIMFFKAEGTMDDSAIPTVERVIEAQDGILEFSVNNTEGVGAVVITKETTVQATGVASQLVELIQGAGFKLHTLSLSFADEEDVINEDAIEFEEEE